MKIGKIILMVLIKGMMEIFGSEAGNMVSLDIIPVQKKLSIFNMKKIILILYQITGCLKSLKTTTEIYG